MGKTWPIVRNTFVQTVRQPIFSVLIVLAMAVLVVNVPISTGFTMGKDQSLLENLGLSTLLVAGLLVSAFSASSALSREIETRTALTVISKPVPRATFVIAKFLGVSLATAVAYFLCCLVFLMVVRHGDITSAAAGLDYPVIVLGTSALAATLLTALLGNYAFNWQFCSTAVWVAMVFFSLAMGGIGVIGRNWTVLDTFGQGIRGQVLIAMVLIFLAVLVFVSVSIAASTRLGQVMTLVVCFTVFIVGSMHPYVFGAGADRNVVFRVLGWAVPNLTTFYPLDALTRGKDIPLVDVGLAAAYAGLFVAGVLAVGVALFEQRPLEAQTSSSVMPSAVVLLAWAGRAGAVALLLAACVTLATPSRYTPMGFAAAAGLAAAAAVTWVLWGYFARGKAWSYWVVAVAAVGSLGRSVATWLRPEATGFVRLGETPGQLALAGAVSAAVLVLLSLPRTRHHFFSATSAPSAKRVEPAA